MITKERTRLEVIDLRDDSYRRRRTRQWFAIALVVVSLAVLGPAVGLVATGFAYHDPGAVVVGGATLAWGLAMVTFGLRLLRSR